MTDATELSTTELRRMARLALRTYLDIAAGRQPGAAGARLLGDTPTPAEPPPAALAHGQLGPVTVVRYRDERAYAAAAVRQDAGRPYGLVAAELAAAAGAWRATGLTYVPDARRVRDADRWALGPDVPAYLQSVLGAVPDHHGARERWALAAALVDDYRQTWGIDDERSTFGPAPTDPEQRRERTRALELTRRLVHEIDAIEPHRSSQRQQGGPELSR